jgi:hypothetical protein
VDPEDRGKGVSDGEVRGILSSRLRHFNSHEGVPCVVGNFTFRRSSLIVRVLLVLIAHNGNLTDRDWDSFYQVDRSESPELRVDPEDRGNHTKVFPVLWVILRFVGRALS